MVATGRSKPVFTSPPGGSSSHEGCRAGGRVVSDSLGSRGGSGTFRRDAVAGIDNFERGRWKGERKKDVGCRSCFFFFRSCGLIVEEVWQRPFSTPGGLEEKSKWVRHLGDYLVTHRNSKPSWKEPRVPRGPLPPARLREGTLGKAPSRTSSGGLKNTPRLVRLFPPFLLVSDMVNIASAWFRGPVERKGGKRDLKRGWKACTGFRRPK